MTWQVAFYPDFLPEFEGLSETVQNEVAALIKVLSAFGPQLRRSLASGRFYKGLIKRADARFAQHLRSVCNEQNVPHHSGR